MALVAVFADLPLKAALILLVVPVGSSVMIAVAAILASAARGDGNRERHGRRSAAPRRRAEHGAPGGAGCGDIGRGDRRLEPGAADNGRVAGRAVPLHDGTRYKVTASDHQNDVSPARGGAVRRERAERGHGVDRGRGWLAGACEGKPPDRVPTLLGEPEVTVGAGRDAEKRIAANSGQRELGDHASGGDLTDLVRGVLGEPEVAVGTGRDPHGGPGSGGDEELRDGARRGDPADLVARELREPEGAVRGSREALGGAPRGGDRKLRDRAGPG